MALTAVRRSSDAFSLFEDPEGLVAKADYLSQQGVGIGGFSGFPSLD